MPRVATIRIDGTEYRVSECRVDHMDDLDEYLASLPAPPVPEPELAAMEGALSRMAEAIVAGMRQNTVPGHEDANREANELALRTLLAREAGKQLQQMREDLGAWPLQVFGGGMRFLLSNRAGKRALWHAMLGTEQPTLSRADAERLYARLTVPEFHRALGAFSPHFEDDEGEGTGPNGGVPAAAGEPAGTTSTTASPPPTAGSPPSSAA